MTPFRTVLNAHEKFPPKMMSNIGKEKNIKLYKVVLKITQIKGDINHVYG